MDQQNFRKEVFGRISRPRLWSEDEKSVNTNIGLRCHETKDVNISYVEEESTTEWTPEIPFENVSYSL